MSTDYIADLPERATIDVRKFDWPGPVTKAFDLDYVHPIKAIMGPQGGGKTTTCAMHLNRSARRTPRCIDGVRRFKWLCVRDTYDRLYRSAVASWLSLVPKTLGQWTGGQGRPASHRVVWETPTGNVDLQVDFVAIGDQAAEDVVRGYEYSGLWLNEGDRLSRDVLTFGAGRGFRWPPMSMFPPGTEVELETIIDLNAPSIDDWFYEDFVEKPTEGRKLYRQPSGRAPNAENLKNLPPGYYDHQIRLNANRPDWIRRFVDNEFGWSREGEAVYPEYQDLIHCAPEPFGFVPGLPVTVGLDAGLHPAAVFRQQLPNGQVRIVAELYFGRMGPTRFIEALKAFIAERLSGCPLTIFVDPTAFSGADKAGGEYSWAESVSLALMLPVLPAPSNELALRIDAVKQPLSTLIDGQPGFLLSPACRRLRKGFNASYHFVRVRGGAGDFHRDVPNKNADESHVHDCLQYAELGARGRYGVISNARGGMPAATGVTVVPPMSVKL